MRTLTAVVLAAVLVVGVAQTDDAQQEERVTGPTIAVVSFDGQAIPPGWYWSCCRRMWAPGYGIAEMVAEELGREFRGSPMELLDRDVLHQLLIDERLHDDDYLSIATATRIGRDLGVDLVVLGQTREFRVIEFDIHPRSLTELANGHVTLTAKIIDTRSGVAVTETRQTTYRARSVMPWDVGDRPRTDLSSGSFRHSFLGRTTQDAARSLGERIAREVRQLTASGAWQTWEGPTVVGFSGGRIAVNCGSEDGVATGDSLRIVRVGRDGEATELGVMRVSEVKSRVAIGRIDRVEDAPAPRPGDRAVPARQ